MKINRRDLIISSTLAGLAPRLSFAKSMETTHCQNSIYLNLEIEPEKPYLKQGIIQSGAAKLGYWDSEGPGPTVIFMHPVSGSSQCWRYQQKPFIEAGFRIIGYSRRGAVGSTIEATEDSTTDVEDLLALMNTLKIDQAHLVACAGGAFVGASFARAHPGRIGRLVLANSLLGVQGGQLDKLLRALKLDLLHHLPIEVRELGPAYRVANPTGTARWLELAQGNRLDSTSRRQANRPPRPHVNSLRDIQAPTLLLAGDADLLAPPPFMEVFTNYIPDSQFRRFPACGHSAYWEVAETFNEAVIAFLHFDNV